MSTAQLAGFVLASWVGGRFLRPVRSVFVIGTVIGVVANLGSAAVPTFELLALTRFASGISLGLSWLFGPIMGGSLIAAGSEVTLGFVAAAVMSSGSFLLLYVDRQRFVVVRQYGTWSQSRASVDSAHHA